MSKSKFLTIVSFNFSPITAINFVTFYALLLLYVLYFRVIMIRVRSFVIYIKEKLNSMNADQQILALDLIEFFMDNSTVSLHSQIGSKEFIGKLISLLKSRDTPQVQIKILRLLKKWGTQFEKSKDILPNFSITYKNLVNSGIEFPVDCE